MYLKFANYVILCSLNPDHERYCSPAVASYNKECSINPGWLPYSIPKDQKKIDLTLSLAGNPESRKTITFNINVDQDADMILGSHVAQEWDPLTLPLFCLLFTNSPQECRNEYCSICHESMSAAERCWHKDCGNFFHTECVKSWQDHLQAQDDTDISFTCPLCRTIIIWPPVQWDQLQETRLAEDFTFLKKCFPAGTTKHTVGTCRDVNPPGWCIGYTTEHSIFQKFVTSIANSEAIKQFREEAAHNQTIQEKDLKTRIFPLPDQFTTTDDNKGVLRIMDNWPAAEFRGVTGDTMTLVIEGLAKLHKSTTQKSSTWCQDFLDRFTSSVAEVKTKYSSKEFDHVDQLSTVSSSLVSMLQDQKGEIEICLTHGGFAERNIHTFANRCTLQHPRLKLAHAYMEWAHYLSETCWSPLDRQWKDFMGQVVGSEPRKAEFACALFAIYYDLCQSLLTDETRLHGINQKAKYILDFLHT